MDVIEQIMIKYHPSKNLIPYLQEHKNQRIIFDIQDAQKFLKESGLLYLQTLKQDEKDPGNWVVRFPSLFDPKTIGAEDIEKVKEAGIPFFFKTYIDRWDMLWGLLDMGVSDIYIVNELGFDLQTVHNLCAKYNCKVRVFPNIAQSSWYTTPDLKKFFIRPEDIDEYKDVVDVFEFFEETEEENINLGEVLYNIYANQKIWYGKLKEIILNFDGDLDGRYTHPIWVTRRINCNKKCLKGSKCDMCNTVAGFGETMSKVGISVTKPKPEKEPPTKEEMDELVKKYYSNSNENMSIVPKQQIEETIATAEEQILDAIQKVIQEEKG